MGRIVDENGYPVDFGDEDYKSDSRKTINWAQGYIPAIGHEFSEETKQEDYKPVIERKQFLVVCDICEEDPNKSQMTSIKFNSVNQMEFKSFSGFTAHDIYKLLIGEVQNG